MHIDHKNPANKILLMLSCIYSGASGLDIDDSAQYIAALILKNSIKSYYAEISETFD